MKNHFTVPKLAYFPLDSGKRWFVWFRYNGTLIKIYKGLMSIPAYEERLIEGRILAEAIHIKLKSGWEPSKVNLLVVKSQRIDKAFFDAIDRIKEKVTKNTYDAYRGAVSLYVESLRELKFNSILAEKFTRAYAKHTLEFVAKKRQWSNHSYNKNLGYLRSVFTEIIEAEQAQVNPFRDIKNLKVIKNPANVPPTDTEMKLICTHLKEKNFGFYIFYMLIYHCGIRPNEIRQLKISQLDFANRMILLDAEKTKSKKYRPVPMLGNVYELLENYKDLDPNLYVFGTWVPNGGRHSQANWFLPNKYPLKEDTPNRQWKKLVKDELGIDKSLYSAKHKGADDKREAGIPIKTICEIFGHSETKMTERYMHSLKLERFEEARKVKTKIF